MTFPLQFLICNVFISLFLGIFLLLKKALHRQITPNAQYRLWFAFFLVLFLPFVPRPISILENLFPVGSAHTVPVFQIEAILSPLPPDWTIPDFSTTVSPFHSIFYTILWDIWLFGMVVSALSLSWTIIKIQFLKKYADPITDQTEPELYQMYATCRKELHIRRDILLYASNRLTSPVSYGWLCPTVIIPRDLDIRLSSQDIRFVFLHELQHYKHRDPLVNNFVCLLQIAYWFNPFIRYGFRRLQADREIACDHWVIQIIGKEQRLNYGHTLLKYAEQKKKGWYKPPLSALNDNKNLLKQRILEIIDYEKPSLLQKIKAMFSVCLTLLMIYTSSPLLCAYPLYNSSFSFECENWEPIDVSSYFDGTDGSFVLYDMERDHYQIYNQTLCKQRISPYSTFNIYSGLFALEENLISPGSSLQKWDGSPQVHDAWNQSQTLDSAMKKSVNWYFQNLDRQMGLSTLRSYYRKISYGNCDLSGGIESYWAESSLKISPLEQVILLSDLLQNKWGFREQNLQTVLDSLFLADTPYGRLYGKTGTGVINGKNVSGWFIGFLKREGRTYCFATNLQNSQIATGRMASTITVKILKTM